LFDALAAIPGEEAGFRSLADAWFDVTTLDGRLMVTLGGLAALERELIRAHLRRTGAGEGEQQELGPTAQAEPVPANARRSNAVKIASRCARSPAVSICITQHFEA
jgi:hypothetical protein